MAKSRRDEEAFARAYQEGFRLFEGRRYAEALRAFGKAIALDRTDTCSWEMFASCLGNLGRYEESLQAFDRTRELGHECESCWYNRSIALLALRRPQEALQAIDRSLELKPDNARPWFDRGLILGMSYGSPEKIPTEPFDGRHELAVAAFDRALELEPGHFGALYSKGYVLWKLSHSATAHHRALEATGTDPDFLRRALACVERALTLQPHNEQARALRDDIREALGGTG
jgi:tetratricopeptide (TPR) repeat protein